MVLPAIREAVPSGTNISIPLPAGPAVSADSTGAFSEFSNLTATWAPYPKPMPKKLMCRFAVVG
jgi:hypothetical protein